MKKIGVVFLILGCFISNVKAASLCNYEEQVELSKSATNIKMTYEEAEGVKEPGTYSVPEMEDPETYKPVYDYFKLKLVNVTEDIYIKLENSTNNEIKYIKYNDTDEGTFEIDWKDLTKVTTFKYTIFTSDESKCPNEELRTGVLTVPMYNRYHNSLACQDAEKSNVCRKFVYSDIDYDVFEASIKSYKEKNKKSDKDEDEIKGDKTLDFIENNKVTIIIISTIIVAGVITGVIVIKKRRRNVL